MPADRGRGYDISTQLVEPLEGSCTTIAQALDATIPDYGDELVDRPRAACEASADGVNAIFATGEDPVACLRAGTCAAHQSSCTWTGLSSPELDAMVAVLDQHAGPVCESQCSDAVSSAMSDLQRCALDLLIQAGRLPEGGCECANRALDEFALIVERYYDVQSAKAVAMTGGVRVSCSDHGGR